MKTPMVQQVSTILQTFFIQTIDSPTNAGFGSHIFILK